MKYFPQKSYYIQVPDTIVSAFQILLLKFGSMIQREKYFLKSWSVNHGAKQAVNYGQRRHASFPLLSSSRL